MMGIEMLSKFKDRVRPGLLLLALSALFMGATPGAQARQSGAGSGASSSQSSRTSNARLHDATYIIGDGDVLAINVWQEQNLTRTISVRSDGRISLPLVGEVQAAGKTPLQLEGEITHLLLKYMTDPEVTVMVEKINSKKFNILGQVVKPGSYALSGSTTVMDAIAAAGGFRDFAKKKDIYVLRQSPDGSESRIKFNYKDFIKGKHPEQNITLEPNDTVIIP
jgi:polysaccharide biosynthesis/export protein